MKARVEATVCDLQDGKVASGAITWKKDGESVTNDLCQDHIMLLRSNGHAPRRGRRPGPQGPRRKKQKRTASKRATAK